MTEISNRNAKEVFWYFSSARARAKFPRRKVTGAMSTHFSYIRECNGVTAALARGVETGGGGVVVASRSRILRQHGCLFLTLSTGQGSSRRSAGDRRFDTARG